jgi:hypothetical protein
MEIVFAPRDSGIGRDDDPLATGVPLTLIPAFASLAVGVSVIWEITLSTLAPYAVVPGLKDGSRDPELNSSTLRSASELFARYTVIAYVLRVPS